jgi:hypothetical protein
VHHGESTWAAHTILVLAKVVPNDSGPLWCLLPRESCRFRRLTRTVTYEFLPKGYYLPLGFGMAYSRIHPINAGDEQGSK